MYYRKGFNVGRGLRVIRTMGEKWDKFLLLSWKNWLLQWRHPLQTLIEVLAPVVFCALLVLIRSLVDPETSDGRVYPPFSLDSSNVLPTNLTM